MEFLRDRATTVDVALGRRVRAQRQPRRRQRGVSVGATGTRQRRIFSCWGSSRSSDASSRPTKTGPAGLLLPCRATGCGSACFTAIAAPSGNPFLLRGEAHEVVGIMPETFRSSGEEDVWTPARPSRSGEGGGANYPGGGAARLHVDRRRERARTPWAVDVRGTWAAQGRDLELSLVPMKEQVGERRAGAHPDAGRGRRRRAAHCLRQHRGASAVAAGTAPGDRHTHGDRQPRGCRAPVDGRKPGAECRGRCASDC